MMVHMSGTKAQPEHSPPEQPEGPERDSGPLLGCVLAFIIGAALIYAFRFFYLHTPLGRVIRDLF